MRHPSLFALPFASLCPLYAFGFPSVSLFWTVSNLTSFNNLPSDYPLDSRSVEWLILGRVLLRRDALRSVTPVQGLYKLARNAKSRFRRRQSCAPFAGTWRNRLLFGLGLRGQREFLSLLSRASRAGKLRVCPRVPLTWERIWRLHVAIQCSLFVTYVLSKSAPGVQTSSAFRGSICEA
jgi:hypothetical protein